MSNHNRCNSSLPYSYFIDIDTKIFKRIGTWTCTLFNFGRRLYVDAQFELCIENYVIRAIFRGNYAQHSHKIHFPIDHYSNPKPKTKTDRPHIKTKMQRTITSIVAIIVVSNATIICHNTTDCANTTLGPDSHIICQGELSCAGKTLECKPDEDCRIECNGESACEPATIICPSNAKCEVYCPAYGACYDTTINATTSIHLHVTSLPFGEILSANASVLRNGDMGFAVGNADILCPICGSCNVEFVGIYSGQDSTRIDATYSYHLTVYAIGAEAFLSGSMHCPIGGYCSLQCDGTWRGGTACERPEVFAANSSWLQIDVFDGLNAEVVLFDGIIRTPDHGHAVVNLHPLAQTHNNKSILSGTEFNSKYGTQNLDINCLASGDPELEKRCFVDADELNKIYCGPDLSDWCGYTGLDFCDDPPFVCGNDTSSTVQYINPLCTLAPTSAPTGTPTNAPTRAPTNAPTQAPTRSPTNAPTKTMHKNVHKKAQRKQRHIFRKKKGTKQRQKRRKRKG
eukprot:705761_1